jgi:hypothetical protein
VVNEVKKPTDLLETSETKSTEICALVKSKSKRQFLQGETGIAEIETHHRLSNVENRITKQKFPSSQKVGVAPAIG